MAGGGGDSRWLITYGDLVTLLMAFFVCLYGISRADKEKFNQFLGGLGAFGNEAAVGDGILDGAQSIIGSDAQTQEGVVPAPAGDSTTTGVGGSGRTHVLTQGEVDALIGDLQKGLADKGLANGVTFRHEARGLVAAIATDQVLFDTGSTQISDRGREIVGAIGPRLALLDNEVVVEGHTDDVPLDRGGYNNWNLSTDRAVAIVRLLQEAHRVNPAHLTATGYGEFRPVAANTSAGGRAANRRVEIVVMAVDVKTDATTRSGATRPAATTNQSHEADPGKEQAHG